MKSAKQKLRASITAAIAAAILASNPAADAATHMPRFLHGDLNAASSTKVIVNAYSADGTNAGVARLGRTVSIQASAPGVAGAVFQWTLTGPGTVSSTGVYTAPAAMPSTTTAIVKATLVSNPAVTSSYAMALAYAVPAIRWAQPSIVTAGKTNSVAITGYDFTPATTILVWGKAVPAVFQAPNVMVAQVAVANGVSQLAVVAQNPSPGGGSSAALTVPTQKTTIVLAEYSTDGVNSGVARLGHTATIQASAAGITSPVFLWTLNGAGTLTSAGVYTAPATMPANTHVTVTATLASNPTVSSAYSLALQYAAPAIRWTTPTILSSGTTNSVSIAGYDFTPATTILVAGKPVSATFQNAGSMLAQIPVGPVSLGALAIVATNPLPGGGSSPAATATIQPLTISLSSYSPQGLNPTSVPLGLEVQYIAALQGSGNSSYNWAYNWTVTGGGTISPGGLYKAPATMPSGNSAVVTATLANLPSVTASSTLALNHQVPMVNGSSPVDAPPGKATVITFRGEGFEPGTVLLVNGVPTPVTYVSSSALTASISVNAGATESLLVKARNAAPGGGIGSSFLLPIAGANTVSATIGTTPGLAIPGNFIGLSHEWGDAQGFMGWSAVGINPIYRQLVANLTNPGSPFLIRIGGGSSDNSVEPAATIVLPFAELAQAMPVVFTLGVNLGANNLKLAQDQAAFFAANMPSGSIKAIEIGNEPDLYAGSGRRASTYAIGDYLADLSTWKNGIQPLLPPAVRLMSSSWSSVWYMQQHLDAMEQQQGANLAITSQHLYAGHQAPGNYFQVDYLLQPSVSINRVPALGAGAAAAHKYGQLFRVAEMNSIDNGGLAGVSNAFSSALWSIDTMFEYANVGVDGVNWHGTSGCTYCAFSFGVQGVGGKRVYTLQQVNPLYYGLLFFHQATANAARLLPVAVSSVANVKVWATVDKAGTVHVAILNKDETFAGTVAVTLPGYGQAKLTRLVAPSFRSTAGVSLAGQSFDGSMDGTLVGSPTTETVDPSGSVYEVPVQPASAVLLTVNP